MEHNGLLMMIFNHFRVHGAKYDYFGKGRPQQQERKKKIEWGANGAGEELRYREGKGGKEMNHAKSEIQRVTRWYGKKSWSGYSRINEYTRIDEKEKEKKRGAKKKMVQVLQIFTPLMTWLLSPVSLFVLLLVFCHMATWYMPFLRLVMRPCIQNGWE
ncbi:hypothetical protein BC940DRAFT_13603 [Gongronella butleri]|nr:hypothetical protein BC940DRAFT_13603 [Gongronella butleri]